MDLFFCHGLESAPHGRKYHGLCAAGFDVVAPDFRGLNLAARVAKLTPLLAAVQRPLVVGSSYGGITALCSAMGLHESGHELNGLVLCAPALARDEPPANITDLYAPCPTVIIHGVHDVVVPIEVSRELAQRDNNVELIEVDDGHRLADSLAVIVGVVRRFA